MIDICTVVFQPELGALKVQAESVTQYASTLGIKNIYVIVNDTDHVASEIDCAWWGVLADRVTIVSKRAFGVHWAKDGWLTQQVLKILTASMSYNTYTMVLDAKTFLVKNFDLDHITHQGRPAVGTFPIQPVFGRSAKIAGDLWDRLVLRQLGPAGVPFFFHNATIRQMIANIENSTQQSFPLWFQQQGMLTEFILYSAWVEHCNLLDDLYSAGNIHVCNINHSDTDRIDPLLNHMISQDLHTVSIHRNAWVSMTVDQCQRYRQFLISRGLSTAVNL